LDHRLAGLPERFSTFSRKNIASLLLLGYLLFVLGAVTLFGRERNAEINITIVTILISISLVWIRRRKPNLPNCGAIKLGLTVLALIYSFSVVSQIAIWPPPSFPIHYREIGYNVWSAEDYFAELAQDFQDGQCMAFFDGGNPPGRLWKILSVRNIIAVFGEIDPELLLDIPLVRIELPRTIVQIFSPNCNCDNLLYYSDDLTKISPSSGQLMVLEEFSGDFCGPGT